MAVKQVLPPEVKSLLDAGHLYLDVRSTHEFEQGHVPGALNIPLLHFDPVRGQMSPNPDFLRVVEAAVPKDSHVVCGCASGQRSLRAAEILQQAGYPDVVNMAGGFTGARDPMGRVVVQGWLDHGLPASRESDERTAYESLLRLLPAP